MMTFSRVPRIPASLWLVLALMCSAAFSPLPSHAQLPFVDPQQALAQMMQQLAITAEQEPAFRAAMVKVDARREAFRAELTQLAGGSGVDMDTLMAYAERMQKDSEALLADVLTAQQMDTFRQMNSFTPFAAN
ncbi:MAG: hypothetical protein WBJ75_06495 [Pseudohongiellaceae bacterium]|nr:MAG: hypothetical protein A3H44_01065 [Gammaproteobacteria bacterium RIFCSPLOWO2_02_FULL_57_10]